VFLDPRFEAIYERHPLVLADIGARGGLKPNWSAARRHLRVLGFEPDRQEFLRLRERQPAATPDRLFGVALHHTPGRIRLNLTKDRGLSSIFTPNREFLSAFPDHHRFDSDGAAEVEADTLDHVLETSGIGALDFIKADTQGSELFVLQGAATALSQSVLGVEVEAEFAPVYIDQPLFADVDALLRGFGFALFDLRPCYWKRAEGRSIGGPHGQIIWADALYLKMPAALGEIAASRNGEARVATFLHAIAIALLYGYADYACDLVRRFGDALPAADRTVIERTLRAIGGPGGTLGALPGSRHVATALRRLWKSSQPRTDAWSISDAELGNLD
jgi:FkbM family methyltransferase